MWDISTGGKRNRRHVSSSVFFADEYGVIAFSPLLSCSKGTQNTFNFGIG